MKDEELKLKEIEVSHRLDGSGEVVRREGRGEGINVTLLSYTIKYISLTDIVIIFQVGL
jgi:hypothetical protein